MVIVGITLALLLNVSIVTVGKVLWQDPTLRESIAELAPTTTATTTTPITAPANAGTEATSPATSSATSAPAGDVPPAGTVDTEATPGPPSLEELQDHGLPIGWNKTAWPGTNWYLALHLLGILMAGIATSFGAPFWFDLLNRFVNLRATGKPPETAAKTR